MIFDGLGLVLGLTGVSLVLNHLRWIGLKRPTFLEETQAVLEIAYSYLFVFTPLIILILKRMFLLSWSQPSILNETQFIKDSIWTHIYTHKYIATTNIS